MKEKKDNQQKGLEYLNQGVIDANIKLNNQFYEEDGLDIDRDLYNMVDSAPIVYTNNDDDK